MRDNASTMKVSRNSTRPSEMSDALCTGSAASLNSLASAEAIELPGSNSDGLIRYALPMTNVTAIVSPSARPRPSMIPPMTPTFVYGSTMFQTTSHVVQPMPYADSFSTGGTISNTSRITDEMNGITMTDRMIPADRMPMPFGAPRNSGPISQMSPN